MFYLLPPVFQKPVWNIWAAAAVVLRPDGSAGLQVYTRKTQGEEADGLGSGFVECLVGTGRCLIGILIAKGWTLPGHPWRDERCENKIKLAEKQRSIHWKASTYIPTGKQTKPLPLALLRGRALPPLPMWSQQNKPKPETSKQPRTNTTHRVCLRHLRSCDSRPGALRLGPWQSNVVTAPVSLDRQPIRGSPLLWGGHSGGLGHLPDWLSTCCSPICPPAPHSVTTGLSFTLLQAPLPLYLPLPGGTKHMPAVS